VTDDPPVSEPSSAERLRLAAVELLGALTYGQLRAFQVTASVVAAAPDARRADRVATFAIREHRAYTVLRDHLIDETDLAAGVIDRQRAVFDAYFDAIPLDDWRSACAFFAVGLPIAADFGREIAPTLSPETAEVVVTALADREGFEEWALEELQSQMTTPEEVDQVRRIVADMLGRALTGYQGAMSDTDALQVLLLGADGSGEAGAALVRRVAVHVLENHRRRMHALGIDDLS
jgi:hypothetical protein